MMSSSELNLNFKKIKFIDHFDNLLLKNKEYVITGSAACILYGWPTENNDIDVFINPFKLQTMIDDKILFQDELNQNKYSNKEKTVECFSQSMGFKWTFKRAFNNSILLKSYRVMSTGGLYLFYSDLYDTYHKEKYKKKLDWLKYKI